ncbi:MAG: DUF5077 domain-containing protein, partial [Pirellulales bacterium]|nr:DUF5077 domain-containing protein [Pirellulales bacterium]
MARIIPISSWHWMVAAISESMFFLWIPGHVFGAKDHAAVGAEIRIPASTAYLDPDGRGARVSDRSGITGWKDPEVKVLWFGQIKTPGQLECAIQIRLDQGTTSKLRLTVAGQSRETQVTGTGKEEVTTADFGLFHIHEAGYQRFLLESLNEPETPIGDLDALLLSGPAAQNAHFNRKPRRNAASVHLVYPVPEDTDIAAFYCEVTAIEDPLGTFYMACGWHRGYFGMQVNGPEERRIIFSVWDSGGEAHDRGKVDKADRVGLVAKGDGVVTNPFGGEGTGGHSHLVYHWKTGEKQKFLVQAKHDDATHTTYSGFYFRPDQQEWMLISSWRAP